MRTKAAWLIVLGALSGFACSDDQRQPPTETKDAAASTSDSLTAKDLPAPDAAFAADREGDKDLPTPDTGVAPALDVSPADRPTIDVVADAVKEDAPDHPTPLDTAIETDTNDASAESGSKDVLAEAGTKDAPTVDAAADSAAVTNFPCQNDSDCCVAIDVCMAVAYLYSKGPGGAGPPTLPTNSPGDMCLACIPPAIQVRCVSSQCVGEKISSYSSLLTVGHCGYITIPDGGIYALYETIDGGSPVPPRTTWSCGS
jgi:hypothetical protein